MKSYHRLLPTLGLREGEDFEWSALEYIHSFQASKLQWQGTKPSRRWSKLLDNCGSVKLLASLIPVLFRIFLNFLSRFNLCLPQPWYITSSSMVIWGTDFECCFQLWRCLPSPEERYQESMLKWFPGPLLGSYPSASAYVRCTFNKCLSFSTWSTWRKITSPPSTSRGLAYMVSWGGGGLISTSMRILHTIQRTSSLFSVWGCPIAYRIQVQVWTSMCPGPGWKAANY